MTVDIKMYGFRAYSALNELLYPMKGSRGSITMLQSYRTYHIRTFTYNDI